MLKSLQLKAQMRFCFVTQSDLSCCQQHKACLGLRVKSPFFFIYFSQTSILSIDLDFNRNPQ